MIEIKKFTETELEFKEISRIFNLVSHDYISHPDIEMDEWALRDLNVKRDRFLLFKENSVIGFLRYSQGRDDNKKKCFFNIFLDPDYNGYGYRQLLYEKMLKEIEFFKPNALYMEIYDHPNYTCSKNFLLKNKFINKFGIREYSLDLQKVDLIKYDTLTQELNNKGIEFFDAKNELSSVPNHYKKLEKLSWTYSKDFPMPNGIVATREPFDLFMKEQKMFEEKYYGVEIVAVCNDEYIGSTDLHVFSKSDPFKAWTGGLGVLREYRRQGIATAIKVKALKILRKKGIKIVRTDNEENNPMYLINVALGFKPEPYSYEYIKEI